jgi:TatD DNase family protein
MPRYFDSHAHLDDPQLAVDLPAIIDRAAEAGVVAIVAIGTDVESSRRVVHLAEQFPMVYAAVGIQPNYTHEARPEDWQEIESLATHPQVVAIGETGLDHHWDRAPLEIQRDYFDRHIELAKSRRLPLVIHMRESADESSPLAESSCAEDILRMLEVCDAGPGVMHSYTGDAGMAGRFLERQMVLSFAGMVTFKKSDELRAVARQVPDDRLLIETDAPYLSPHPRRGQRPNEPALVTHTAACLAETRGMSVDAFAELTTRNAFRLFGIPDERA